MDMGEGLIPDTKRSGERVDEGHRLCPKAADFILFTVDDASQIPPQASGQWL
jgi:hypothetical protein